MRCFGMRIKADIPTILIFKSCITYLISVVLLSIPPKKCHPFNIDAFVIVVSLHFAISVCCTLIRSHRLKNNHIRSFIDNLPYLMFGIHFIMNLVLVGLVVYYEVECRGKRISAQSFVRWVIVLVISLISIVLASFFRKRTWEGSKSTFENCFRFFKSRESDKMIYNHLKRKKKMDRAIVERMVRLDRENHQATWNLVEKMENCNSFVLCDISRQIQIEGSRKCSSCDGSYPIGSKVYVLKCCKLSLHIACFRACLAASLRCPNCQYYMTNFLSISSEELIIRRSIANEDGVRRSDEYNDLVLIASAF